MKTKHDGDCSLFSSVKNGNLTDGICTCGFAHDLIGQGGFVDPLDVASLDRRMAADTKPIGNSLWTVVAVCLVMVVLNAIALEAGTMLATRHPRAEATLLNDDMHVEINGIDADADLVADWRATVEFAESHLSGGNPKQ